MSRDRQMLPLADDTEITPDDVYSDDEEEVPRRFNIPSYSDRRAQNIDWDTDVTPYTRRNMHEFDFGNRLKYGQPMPALKDIPRKFRKRGQLDAIWDIVGSKHNRSIYRDNDFMSEGALKILNGKRKANGQKVYTGKWELHDGDSIPEFVVYDAHGNIVAVNGYTTKKSDWDIRNKYFTQYPSRDARKKNKYGDFIQDYYTQDPEVRFETDAAGFATDA